ncbi:MAG TPA: hypothetical protein VKT99_03405 [Xanthobacteraceae bacterium]|nr:hypothetical protein [Xanthobacteraceae bacterium]
MPDSASRRLPGGAQLVKSLRCIDCKKLRAGATLNLGKHVAHDMSRKGRRCALIAKALDQDGSYRMAVRHINPGAPLVIGEYIGTT